MSTGAELDLQATVWAFKFMFHRDLMNSAVHCQPVRWSPLTRELASFLSEHDQYHDLFEIDEVLGAAVQGG
jgi:hypothetical protein